MSDKRVIRLVLLYLVAFAVVAGGCGRKAGREATVAPKPPPTPAPVVEPTAGGGEMTPVTAKVRDYTIAPGMSNVNNLNIFKKLLGKERRAMIVKNGFVVTPTNYIQLFHIYELNGYERPLEIPSFITADAMLHQYHIFYDFSLRKVETGKLYSYVEELTSVMLDQSKKDYSTAKDQMVKAAARGNVAYFAVAASLLGKKDIPAYVATEVRADLARIEAHKDLDKSDVLSIGIRSPQFVPVGVNFTQFIPRGHYTRSDKLKRYFKAMMWYGLASMPVPEKTDDSDMPTLRALLATRVLSAAKGQSKAAMELWESVYEPTVFYVGSTDDLTPTQYLKLLNKVYGANPGINAFADKGKLASFIAQAKRLPQPGIRTAFFDMAPEYRIPNGLQLRFMGQRFIFDSRILQELTHPKVISRNFPRGLDVLAALGSKRAYDIIDKTYHDPRNFPQYNGQMAKMRKEVASTPVAKWRSNLYYGWLWCLRTLTHTFGKGYPAFMRTDAWLDKSLNSGLGSWAELRHDTILYAKQSGGSECGGEEKQPPMPKGYVEPNVELWSRLLWLTDKTEAGLRKRGLLTDELAERFDWMSGMLKFLKTASIKELRNEELTREEYAQIKNFGAELETQMLSLYGGDIISDTDKDMAVVADVHTWGPECLEEGVGHAAEIYVVVPIAGKLWLTRGAVFTQYEFLHPSDDRLTDEKWQKMLESGTACPVPSWTKSFMGNGKTPKGKSEASGGGGGC